MSLNERDYMRARRGAGKVAGRRWKTDWRGMVARGRFALWLSWRWLRRAFGS